MIFVFNRVENCMGKGEMLVNSISPFPRIFQKISFSGSLTLSQTSPGFTCLPQKSFKNTVGKGEIAHNEQFLLFPQCFSNHWENFLLFSSNMKLSSADSFNLEEF